LDIGSGDKIRNRIRYFEIALSASPRIQEEKDPFLETNNCFVPGRRFVPIRDALEFKKIVPFLETY
jgi:hypothetical protein